MKRLALDMGQFRELVDPRVGIHERWQDHGFGITQTMARDAGIEFDRMSLRRMSSWGEFRMAVKGFDELVMNVRSYNFPMAAQAAKIFHAVNPGSQVITGGVHTVVALEEMEAVEDFDHIVVGNSEKSFIPIISDPAAFPRIVQGEQFRSMDEWKWTDRTLWPKPDPAQGPNCWPLESGVGWGPAPVVTMLTSRVCPFQCSFCNEASYIANIGRRSVDSLIDELNWIDDTYGGIGSIVWHDSLLFQNPKWLKEFLDKYPRKAHKVWPYWGAARSDLVRRWPDLFEALVRETNWNTISIGFESGSDSVLRTLNKECSAEDNDFTIQLLNDIGDDLEAQGKPAPKFFANIMFAIPGETREDAFATVRMLKSMKRVLPSIAFYAPYPGSALGYQLIAEGKSLMTGQHHRFPGEAKMTGIDYKFYNDLLAGRYEQEVDMGAPMAALYQSQGTEGIFQDGFRDKRRMFALSGKA